MQDPIRLATPDEIAELAATSDLTPQSAIFAFKDARAVVRPVVELDPVYYGSLTIREKMAFVWGLENILRSNHLPAYYFNISTAPEFDEFRAVAEKWGATPISKSPEIRYRKQL